MIFLCTYYLSLLEIKNNIFVFPFNLDKNNQNKNKTCKLHNCRVRDKVLVRDKQKTIMRIRTRFPAQLPILGQMEPLPYIRSQYNSA